MIDKDNDFSLCILFKLLGQHFPKQGSM